MRTAEDCRRKAAEMQALAARSPVRREQYLQMADVWMRLERESAEAEGRIEPELKPDSSPEPGPKAGL
jgi:hypothetical protein